MDTKDFFRSKSDRKIRLKHYKTKSEVKKEVEDLKLKFDRDLLKHISDMSDEIALYGYCLVTRQGSEIQVVDREKFTVGFKND
jgi:hypothetical protein